MPWIRIISPETELQTLSKRELLSEEQLHNQTFRCPERTEHAARINFTPASAFHFFTNKVRQSFFESNEENFGIIVGQEEGNGRDVMFRISQKCEVSDHIFKTSMSSEDFNAALENGKFVLINEQQVGAYVRNAFKENLEECEASSQLSATDAGISWTEGLFRHIFSDIDGIYVNVNNQESIRNGYAFAKTLESIMPDRKFEFYSWNEDNAELVNIDREIVKIALGFALRENSRQYIVDEATQEKIQEYKSILNQYREGRS